MFSKQNIIFIAVLVVPFVVITTVFLWQLGFQDIFRILNWFDPLFFIYNLIIATLMVLVVPVFTWLYVTGMKTEKKRRLERELPSEFFGNEKNVQRIENLLNTNFSAQNYIGSTLVLMLVVFLGAFIILLLKPSFGGAGNGVDYAKGANFLLLGPFMDSFTGNTDVYYHRLVVSLTALQFGFLGAYVYFINHLVRAYFTLDLSPSTYIGLSVRMATGSLVSLVLSFLIPMDVPDAASNDWPPTLQALAAISFIFGYFPSRAMLLLEKRVNRLIGNANQNRMETELSKLPGVSALHEVRLRQEGFDNVENLSHADVVELAVKTGFSYLQISEWVGRSWLRTHLGEHYSVFENSTGILSRDELKRFITTEQDIAAAASKLATSSSIPEIKVAVICHEAAAYTP